MRREDHQYRLGIVVDHNKEQIKDRGSCIFIHVYKKAGASTAGCTAMGYKELEKIAQWLDPAKEPLLIQIPKSAVHEVLKLYPQLQKSKLLQR